MKPIRISIKVTIAEQFFIEKSIELLFHETLDTYRLRLHSPKSILQELVAVLNAVKKNEIADKNKEYLIDETLFMLKHDQDFQFDGLEKSYLQGVLGNGNIDEIIYAASIVINENQEYCRKTFFKIIAEIVRLNSLVDTIKAKDFDRLNWLIHYFYVELVNLKGFSRIYLHKFIRAIFSDNRDNKGFSEKILIIGSLLDREEENFEILIGFRPIEGQNNVNFLETEYTVMAEHGLKEIVKKTNKKIKLFFEENKNLVFYKIPISAVDYYTASNKAKMKLYRSLDILHMGFIGEFIVPKRKCIVIGEIQPKKASVLLLDYMVDGFFKKNISRYNQFLEKAAKIDNNKIIDPIAKSKIFSALRYLRLGSHVEDMEIKLVDYWIAFEYLFSKSDRTEDKTHRIKEYFKKVHSLTYIKRILSYYHNSIENIGLSGMLSGYAEDLFYFNDPETFSILEDTIHVSPLHSYRAFTLKSKLLDNASIKVELNRHQQNIFWNIARIYRARNEIVHKAGHSKNISEITSHLRYYLVFILNGLIDFYLNTPIDSDGDGVSNIDDYLLFNNAIYESINKSKSVSIKQLLNFKDPIDYLV